MTSPQEEETLALAAIVRLGEASAHDIATEMGVQNIRQTLGRLVAGRRARKRLVMRNGFKVWVFEVVAKEPHAARQTTFA